MKVAIFFVLIASIMPLAMAETKPDDRSITAYWWTPASIALHCRAEDGSKVKSLDNFKKNGIKCEKQEGGNLKCYKVGHQSEDKAKSTFQTYFDTCIA